LKEKNCNTEDLEKRIASLEERAFQNTKEFVQVFNYATNQILPVDDFILYRLTRLAGTTLIEAAYILLALKNTHLIEGDWCEYGVAHGRTSALLAQALLALRSPKKIYFYDSFEGLPKPHEKDILINDLYGLKEISAYTGKFNFPQELLIHELGTVSENTDYYHIVKGWIEPDLLKHNSPSQISFAFLDMDFYQSTYDVLIFLTKAMSKGGIVIVDDFGFFSSGIKTAVDEVLLLNPYSWKLTTPFYSKFAFLEKL